jgi:hypothetical protein
MGPDLNGGLLAVVCAISVTACGPKKPQQQPAPPAAKVVAGDRLVVVLEATPDSNYGGGATLQFTGVAPLRFVAFRSPTSLKQGPGFAGELYLLSDPLTPEQLDFSDHFKEGTFQFSLNLSFVAGHLVADSEHEVRAHLAGWHVQGEDATVFSIDTLDKPFTVEGM